MDAKDLPLGKPTDYPKSYSRDLLVRIPRADARSKLESNAPLVDFQGYDLWTLYELNWVSSAGVTSAVIGEVRVPADSEFIVESKSLKLYINSLYYRRFGSADQVRDEMAQALTSLLGAQIIVHLWPLADFGGSAAQSTSFVNLDLLGAEMPGRRDNAVLCGEPLPAYTRTYKTDCFRSLCPVTEQPDWASVYVGITGVKPDETSLAAYLLGYSEHQGFHESCVEQIYTDLSHCFEPEQLTVAARFTRRGGIDINPYRTGKKPVFAMPPRAIRQ